MAEGESEDAGWDEGAVDTDTLEKGYKGEGESQAHLAGPHLRLTVCTSSYSEVSVSLTKFFISPSLYGYLIL